jgi:Uma2 family endonuclease
MSRWRTPVSRRASGVVMLSVEEFSTYDTPDGKAELVRGELRMSPPPRLPHAAVIARLIWLLMNHVVPNRLGHVFSNGGFELIELPRTVRSPDVAFVRAGRLPGNGVEAGFSRVPPDLVVEVISPSETRARRQEKLDDYHAVRVPLIWLIDPIERTATVIAHGAPPRLLRETDSLDGGDVLPDFQCEVGNLFVDLARD